MGPERAAVVRSRGVAAKQGFIITYRTYASYSRQKKYIARDVCPTGATRASLRADVCLTCDTCKFYAPLLLTSRDLLAVTRRIGPPVLPLRPAQIVLINAHTGGARLAVLRSCYNAVFTFFRSKHCSAGLQWI